MKKHDKQIIVWRLISWTDASNQFEDGQTR